ncbi:MAG: DUF4386 domain-containing protein [Anaerolineales bacterium]
MIETALSFLFSTSEIILTLSSPNTADTPSLLCSAGRTARPPNHSAKLRKPAWPSGAGGLDSHRLLSFFMALGFANVSVRLLWTTAKITKSKQAKKENTMTRNEKRYSPQKTARVAAIVFLIIFFQGMSAELFIRPDIIVPGDAATTVNNIVASESLFRLSLVSDLIRQMFILLLVLVLYKLLKPVNKSIAMLMVIFALISIPITMLNELNHFAALLLSTVADYQTAFGADQLNTLVMFFLELRNYGTFIPGIFSLWVLLLGYLVFKSGFLPRILGLLLMIGGICYSIQAVLFFLYPNFDTMILGLFAFIGEFIFYLWLLIKGVNVEQWEQCTLESA